MRRSAASYYCTPVIRVGIVTLSREKFWRALFPEFSWFSGLLTSIVWLHRWTASFPTHSTTSILLPDVWKFLNCAFSGSLGPFSGAVLATRPWRRSWASWCALGCGWASGRTCLDFFQITRTIYCHSFQGIIFGGRLARFVCAGGVWDSFRNLHRVVIEMNWHHAVIWKHFPELVDLGGWREEHERGRDMRVNYTNFGPQSHRR